MPDDPRQSSSAWHRSIYLRIALGLLVSVVAVLVAQSLMFGYLMARQSPDRSPNVLAANVAADVGRAMAQDRALDVDAYLKRNHGHAPQGLYVVLPDARVAANTRESLAPDLLASAQAQLTGGNPAGAPGLRVTQGPVVTAPIVVSRQLVGMVVLPPPSAGIAREAGRLLSLPSILTLVVATLVATALIFAPARRRLKALEDATVRLGRGDLEARAPEGGGDEVAHVSRAFNRMAADLAARDESLRQSGQLRRQMLADISHELRTPLTTMRAYLETLQMPSVRIDEQRRARYIETVARETNRLERIVSDLLELARHESGAVAYSERVFDIGRVFDHVIRRHEHEAQQRHIDFTRRVLDGVDQAVGDPDRLEQVMENLVANALRHTPDGGTVMLGAENDDGRLVLSVVDSGTGIPAGHLPHVFERFYRTDEARSADAGGSGLGLSIVKAVIERLGGTVGVRSEPGRTEFRIVLPLRRLGSDAIKPAFTP